MTPFVTLEKIDFRSPVMSVSVLSSMIYTLINTKQDWEGRNNNEQFSDSISTDFFFLKQEFSTNNLILFQRVENVPELNGHGISTFFLILSRTLVRYLKLKE